MGTGTASCRASPHFLRAELSVRKKWVQARRPAEPVPIFSELKCENMVALFDSDFLKKLEYLSLISKRVFRGSLMAQRRTLQLGTGIEFADHREYTPGDDYRYIDWNLYARHDELLLKRFQEEEDLHVYFLVDCSRSMAYGSPPKFDFARQVAAALAYIALADLDRIAVVAFAQDIVDDFPLTR